MDSGTVTVIALALVVLVALAAILRYRKRMKLGLKGPAGMGLDLEGSNEGPDQREPSRPGVRVEDAVSRSGGLTAADGTGQGADVRRVEVERDIQVTSDPGPKAGPPA